MTAVIDETALFPTDWQDQADVVNAVAESPAHVADPEFELFIDACRTDAYTHGGFVSQNRVRAALSNDDGLTVNPRRYSGFWSRAKREGFLSKKYTEEDNRDKKGRNLGKKSKIHRWLGGGVVNITAAKTTTEESPA